MEQTETEFPVPFRNPGFLSGDICGFFFPHLLLPELQQAIGL
jgi:hypothetical protein